MNQDPEDLIELSVEKTADPVQRATALLLAREWAKQQGYGEVTDIRYIAYHGIWVTWSETFTPIRESFNIGNTLSEAIDFFTHEMSTRS